MQIGGKRIDLLECKEHPQNNSQQAKKPEKRNGEGLQIKKDQAPAEVQRQLDHEEI